MLYARHSSTDSMRSAPCPPGEGISYGLFEIRCRQPVDGNSWPAFWLYGAPDEVDVFEGYQGGFCNNVIHHAHEYWYPGPLEEPACQCYYFWPGASNLTKEFHRYALEWMPQQLTFYFDGVPIRRETRFRPLGCAMAIITNLAMWAWATPIRDSLEIDYIRIYRPRRLPVSPFGTAPPPTSDLFRLPRASAPERSNPVGEQFWQLWLPESGRIGLALRDNLNPACDTNIALPTSPDWCPAWVVSTRDTPVQVNLPDTTALRWTITDALGKKYSEGLWRSNFWRPPIANLPAGFYMVKLQVQQCVRTQALFIINIPHNPSPAGSW